MTQSTAVPSVIVSFGDEARPGRQRVALADINVGGFDPELMAEAVIERAVIVRDENDSLELPPFELYVGHGAQQPTRVAHSEAFDVGGVAVLDTSSDAMAMLSQALSAHEGFVEFGTIDGAVPGLVSDEDGSLRRPSGAMRLSLVLHLRLPIAALAGALQEP